MIQNYNTPMVSQIIKKLSIYEFGNTNSYLPLIRQVNAVLITLGHQNRNHRSTCSVSCVLLWLPDVLEHWER